MLGSQKSFHRHLDPQLRDRDPPAGHRPWKFRVLLAISIAGNILAVVAFARHLRFDTFISGDLLASVWSGSILDDGLGLQSATGTQFDDGFIAQCPSVSRTPPATPPARTNPWAQLSPQEASQVQLWLERPELNLNLTRSVETKASDNIIFLIEAYHPPKAAVLAYLDDPAGETKAPDKHARVVIHHGALPEPVVRDYVVGPLPVGPKTTLRVLSDVYHRDTIPYDARGIADLGELVNALAEQMEPLVDIFADLFGLEAGAQLNQTLAPGVSGPFSYDGSFRRLWLSWRRNVAGSFILPVGLYQYFDLSGTDPRHWKILKTVYHDQVFDTTEDFLDAYHNGTIKRVPGQADPGLDIRWPERRRIDRDRDLDHLPGPRSVSFAGLRFRVDREQQHVSWLGWSVYLGFERDMGLNLWDIRFRGERIIYQLAPQEALAQYGGQDPVQGTTAWLDRYFGFGLLVRDMIPNYDCPAEAVFLPAVTYSAFGKPAYVERERAICIFEQDTGKPISRHFGDFDGEFGAVKGYTLTIRSISTLGNYDYLYDYVFYLDGTIEVRISASGYMQGGYWNEKQSPYGSRIHKFSMGNVHDHVMNFKVDFDIAGTNNSLLRTATEVESVTHPWLGDDWGHQVIQQKIVKTYIDNENDALLRYSPNFRTGYSIVNKDALNAWGYPRGYGIHPGNSPIHNTVPNSKRMLNNANWARYNLAVSRRKETEPSSSSMWNLHLSGNPMVDFHKFFDNESLDQEDVVAWINVGMHHLPSAEDSPNTKTNIATSSFLLTPINYFDYDVSMELRNAILFHPPDEPDKEFAFDENGVDSNRRCMPHGPPSISYKNTPVIGLDGSRDYRKTPLKQALEFDMYLRPRGGEGK